MVFKSLPNSNRDKHVTRRFMLVSTTFIIIIMHLYYPFMRLLNIERTNIEPCWRLHSIDPLIPTLNLDLSYDKLIN